MVSHKFQCSSQFFVCKTLAKSFVNRIDLLLLAEHELRNRRPRNNTNLRIVANNPHRTSPEGDTLLQNANLVGRLTAVSQRQVS